MILPTSTRVHRLALYLIELSKMTVHRLVPLTLLHTAHKILFLFRFKPSCRKPGFISPKKKKKTHHHLPYEDNMMLITMGGQVIHLRSQQVPGTSCVWAASISITHRVC